jgi:hypothetical protein
LDSVVSWQIGPVKPFQDILQKRYNFDDRDIFKATVEKEIVKKGAEFIDFKILTS